MGAFRLILSLMVVGSHVGGLGDSPAGGTAVASFFAISGFLMARTISENYPGGGFPRFYLNRLIRLGPPLLAVLAMTALVLWARDSRGFEIVRGAEQRYMPVEFPPSPGALVEWNLRAGPTFMVPQFHLVPQAWSLVVEGAFYLAAPVGVWLMSRRREWVVWAAMVVSFALAVAAGRMQLDWMRSPFATAWMFLLGGQVYFLAISGRARAAGRFAAWAPLPLVPVVVMGLGWTPVPPSAVLMLAPWLVVTWLLLAGWHSRRGSRLDQALGNLSYGVFLGHFLSTLLFLWIAEAAFAATGAFGIFGIPDVSDTRLHVTAYVAALAAGAAIYYVFERPLDALRAAVRRRQREVSAVVDEAAPAG